MGKPFLLFPWEQPFLEAVQDVLWQSSGGDLGRMTIIMPHSRPRRYLTDLFLANKHIPRPALLPRMLTLQEMLEIFLCHTHAASVAGSSIRMRRKAELLDGVYLLFKAVQRLQAMPEQYAASCTAPLTALAKLDLAGFLPWGMRLFALFEECMQQLTPVQNIVHAAGEVSPLAAEILASLEYIHRHYLELLEEEGFVTPGLEALEVATQVALAVQNNATCIPPLLASQDVFLVGFNTLTESEDVLLKALWKQGAQVCLHSDPKLMEGQEQTHWSCQEHSAWLRRWKATVRLAISPCDHTPTLHFVSAYDVHSQLLALQKELLALCTIKKSSHSENDHVVGSAAVVLTSPSLLVPTLHHLPKDTPFNVSMGYPLEKSALFSLIEAIMRLQESARAFSLPVAEDHGDGQKIAQERRYHWRQFLHCLRHPFVQMLLYPTDGEGPRSLRAELSELEKKVRLGERFVSVRSVLTSWQLHPYFTEGSLPLLQQLFTCLMENFATVRTAQELGEALSQLCQMLLSHGQEVWERYAFDAESMYRLVKHVIPALRVSSLADEILPQATLFALCRQCIKAERVPFEADPLTGLQVLGMLETRLLHFDTVYIVDATDNALPGFSAADPLLPDALRPVLGLPGLHERERIMAHTLYRLVASAKEVFFYWQEGAQYSTLLDDKKSRSRFVDAYLWEEAQRRGRIIESNDAPLRTVASPIYPIVLQEERIVVTPQIRQKIQQMLVKGLSPSSLDVYLQCPLQFAWKYIYDFKSLDVVNEGDDPQEVGTLLHNVLQKAYAPWEGKKLLLEDITLDYLLDIFEYYFSNSTLQQSLPAHSLMLLRMAAPLRLERFLAAQKEQIPIGYTHIECLEKKLLAPIQGVQGENFYIKGVLDRVDRRTDHACHKELRNGLVVLDYKTGKNIKVSAGAWTDMDLRDDLAHWTPHAANSDDLMQRVATAFPSLQLACYLYLCETHFQGKEAVLDAALVALGDKGQEVYYLDKIKCLDREDIVQVRIKKLLTFVLQHLQSTSAFCARKTDACKYCAYVCLCER